LFKKKKIIDCKNNPQLKGEKTVIMSKLISLERRISDMKNQVGIFELKN
jgi:hypothetical protein